MKVPKLNNRVLFFSPTVQAGWQKQSHITDFKLSEKLGSGSFGTVYKAIHKKTNKVYAIKQIKKSALDSQKLLQHAKTEVKIMYKLNHPNIIKLYNHFQDEVSIFLVLQYAAKGQLYTLLKTQPDKRFSEAVASEYIKQITEGIKQIHSQKIMHRDLKLQNILVDEGNNIKIADFGWSHFVDPEKRTTYCGTLDYLAPEMVEKGHAHDERVDIWSIGVLIYELCTGYSPFSCTLTGNDISIDNVKKNIKNISYKMPTALSQDCQDIIRKILKKNPEERISIQQILTHPWIKRGKVEKQTQKQKEWMQSLKMEVKEMFPQQTILTQNTENSDGFSKQQIYKYTRPDSIINLKPKMKKNNDINSPPGIEQGSKIQQSSPESKINQSHFDYKKLSELELKVMQLQVQRKTDQQQITRLNEQLIRMKDHKQCKQQVKQLMDQIINQNKLLMQLNNKLSESERKLMQYEKKG